MTGHCKHPWYSTWINAAGKVTCCPQNSIVFGDLNETPFEQLWNSTQAQKVRKNIFDGNYGAAGCDSECPFLRGDSREPIDTPPDEELIAPAFDIPLDTSEYSVNYHNTEHHFIQGTAELDTFPLFVDIQPLVLCNFDCFMCDQPHKDKMKHREALESELGQLKPYANYFRWQGGEVFLLANFADYLNEFVDPKYPNLRRYIITNGSKLSNDEIDILTTGPNPVHFLVSMDGATEETFYKIRKRKSFSKTFGAIKYLASVQKKQGRRDIVRWNYVVTKSTLGEMKLAIETARDLDVDINFAPLQGNYPTENIFKYSDLIPRKELIAHLEELEKYSEHLDINVSGFTGMYVRIENANKAQTCRSETPSPSHVGLQSDI